MLTRDGSVPSDPLSRASPCSGSGAARAGARCRSATTTGTATKGSGPWVQVSRLGNPLFNEVIVPIGDKDRWNARRPDRRRATSRSTSNQPELAKLLPVLYPGVFPNLAAYTAGPGGPPRDPAHRAFPAGVVPGFQNFTGPRPADMLRLNVAIPPTRRTRTPLGVVGGDLAGFPNGRRVFDDVVSIELKAVAGRDDPARRLELHAGRRGRRWSRRTSRPGAGRYQSTFPYLGTPHDGFDTPSS